MYHYTLDWNGKLMRTPPITPSIISCRILKVEYFVRVTLLIPGSLLNLHVELPIVIGMNQTGGNRNGYVRG